MKNYELTYEFVNDESFIKGYKEKLDHCGMPLSGFLLSFDLRLYVKTSSSYLFLSDEVWKLKNLFTALIKLELFKKNASWDLPQLNIVIPLIRVVLEGFFRVLYVYRFVDENNFEQEEIEERFSKIVKIFLKEYDKYREDLKTILKTEADKEAKHFLPKLEGEGQGFSVYCMLGEIFGGISKETERKAYLLYRFCCLYSHGNTNMGLLKAAKVSCLPNANIFNILEDISHHYIVLLENILSCEVFSKAVSELEISPLD